MFESTAYSKGILKIQFAEQYQQNYRDNFADTKENNKRYEFIIKYMAGDFYQDFTTKSTMDSKISLVDEILNALGFYIYSVASQTNPIIEPFSSGSDITMNNVVVTYDSYNNRWLVAGGGYWSNASWYSDVSLPLIFPAGNIKNVGGFDAIGVALYSTSGTRPTMIDAYAYYHDNAGTSYYNYNPENLDGAAGAISQYQDRVLSHGGILFGDVSYIGWGFSAVAVYNSAFANFHGWARTQYTHTWNETNITGIGIGDKSFSIDVSHSSNYFTIRSSGETAF